MLNIEKCDSLRAAFLFFEGVYLRHPYVRQQDEVHHQGVDDSGNGDDLVVEDERAAGDRDGLCGILHADLDDKRAPLFGGQVKKPSE